MLSYLEARDMAANAIASLGESDSLETIYMALQSVLADTRRYTTVAEYTTLANECSRTLWEVCNKRFSEGG